MQGNSSFQATRWTLVQRVKESNTEEAQEALNVLCSMYWKPLYAFARVYVRSMEDAEDVVQGFLAKGIEKVVTCQRIGVAVLGLEVPHAHIHLIPFTEIPQLNFSNASPTSQEELGQIAERIRQHLA